jgi:hypothetical protein
VLLTVLAMFVLLAEPRRYLEPILFAVTPLSRSPLPDEIADYYGPWPPQDCPPRPSPLEPGCRHIWVLNRMVPNILVLLLALEHLLPRLGLSGTIVWLEGPKTVSMTLDEGQFRASPEIAHWSSMRMTTSLYDDGQPWDTFAVMFLWLWCGFLWLRMPRAKSPPVKAEEPMPEMMILPEVGSEQIREMR